MRRGGGKGGAARKSLPWQPGRRAEWLGVALLLVLHAGLVGWGIARQSVTYDENFHVPAGVVAVARGDAGVSAVNPPLVKWLLGAAALAAGARVPPDSVIATHDQRIVGESFMRLNAAHYHAVFAAARVVNLLLSLLLAIVVWRIARTRWGPKGGWLALAAWALAPEALAHAGVATMDVATALLWTASAFALERWLGSGRWRDWAIVALVLACFALVRFTFVLVAPLALALVVRALVQRTLKSPGRVVAGLALLVPVGWLAIVLGYGGKFAGSPLSHAAFLSARFQSLQHAYPTLRLPLPDAFLRGLDRQAFDGEPGHLATYVLGRIVTHAIWWYFPFAIACKWPLALLAAAVARGVQWWVDPASRSRSGVVLLAGLVFLLPAMFLANLDAGVRYMLPLLPLAAIEIGALASEAAGPLQRAFSVLAAVCVLALVFEVAPAGPNWLAFFNRAAGGPGGGEGLLNDSNIDWGQGLIALRGDLQRLGIRRVYLTYQGTTDPANYGIDYVPYAGGAFGTESDWYAVSSYFFVGLPQALMTRRGYSQVVVLNATPLRSLPPAAHPAGCMWLYRIR